MLGPNEERTGFGGFGSLVLVLLKGFARFFIGFNVVLMWCLVVLGPGFANSDDFGGTVDLKSPFGVYK